MLNSRSSFRSKSFYLIIFILIAVGWKNKEASYLTPETGLGYWLGIIGGSLMLVLLLYPLRKKIRFLSGLGKIKSWFKMHMLFGVLGPLAVLFHANFSLGSANSNVALFSMIIVASSGLVGRYLYAKIHHGLYGRKADLKELRQLIKVSRKKLGKRFTLNDEIVSKINYLERLLMRDRNIIFAALLWPLVFIRTWLMKSSIKRLLYKTLVKAGTENGWGRIMTESIYNETNFEMQPYIKGMYELYGFRIYEGLFSLWHLLHYPLFIMLVFSGIVHVVVVHSY